MIVLEKCLVRCECGFQWFSADRQAAERAVAIHRETCATWGQSDRVPIPDDGATILNVLVWQDPAHHCRENEPPQIPPPSRADRDGKCSWNCRGSYSWNCYCPCLGERHGANHVWDPDERAKAIEKAIEDIYSKIERAKPRGDWPGRKST